MHNIVEFFLCLLQVFSFRKKMFTCRFFSPCHTCLLVKIFVVKNKPVLAILGNINVSIAEMHINALICLTYVVCKCCKRINQRVLTHITSKSVYSWIYYNDFFCKYKTDRLFLMKRK